MSAALHLQASHDASMAVFVQRQLMAGIPYIPISQLTGKVAIITGSNIGLGLEASKQMLQLGLARLIMAVRSPAKGNLAATELRRVFPRAQIDIWALDMDSYTSIIDFATRCRKTLARLDIVVLNAGSWNAQFRRNEATGHESTLQVNYLSTVLLAIFLLSVLKTAHSAGQPGRLSIVGSDTAYTTRIEIPLSRAVIASLDMEDGYRGMEQYSQTKLLLVMFVSKLVGFVDARNVVVNVVHPGLIKGTSFFATEEQNLIYKLGMSTIGRSIRDGARTYLVATALLGSESHGSIVAHGAIRA